MKALKTGSLFACGSTLLAAALLLAAIPASAGVLTIPTGDSGNGATFQVPAGTDFWRTAGEGRTYYSFADNPLPADFFCPGSAPFAGVVNFEGRPVATAPAGAFGEADTIIERLDPVVFDSLGTAKTRVVVRALSLVSAAPIDTACGSFDVTARMSGEQPVETMRFQRTESGKGTAIAPLALDIALDFTPVGSTGGATHSVLAEIRFPGLEMGWQPEDRKLALRTPARVRVDSDGDGVPDLAVPGSRNVQLGHAPGVVERIDQCIPRGDGTYECPICHSSSGDWHCYWP